MICTKKNLLFIILFSFFGLIKINSQINANFSADTLSGCSPVYVTFKNLSTPSKGVSYFWDFGNGVTSKLKNPANIYIKSGSFSVKLIVSDSINSDTMIKNNFINIYKPPKANISITENYGGCVPFSVNFINSSTSANSEIKYQLWNFGDGTYSDLIAPSHIYTDKGTFNVSLFILDNNGCSDYTYLDKLIQTNKIRADFSADNTFSCKDTLKVNFQNLSVGDSITNYLWYFGNGDSSVQKNPTVIYSDTGKFSVSLIIKDKFGCTDTVKKENLILNEHVKASFYVPVRVTCPNSKTFFINKSKNADIFHWYFGDGQISSIDSAVHKYNNGGIYSAKLIASNYFGCSDSFSRKVFVDSISAKFITDKTFTCQLPDTIHYTNLSKNASSFVYHFANGKISLDKNPSNIITHEGVWKDTLIASNENGCSDTYIFSNGIVAKIPKAYFIPNNLVNPYDIMGCVPNTVDFKDVSKYNVTNDSIISWQWNFGDGQSSSSENPSHTFTSLDTFFVSLKVTSALGCSTQYGAWAYTGTQQHADFSFNIPDTICASDPVSFTNLSQDSNLINLNYWQFSDSTFSYNNNPVHYFQDTGYASVILNTYYNGCGDSTERKNITYVKGPINKITADYDCNSRFSPLLKGNIKNATKFSWYFDDGSALDSIHENPNHIFPHRGYYNVILNSQNEQTGCSYSSKAKIKIFSAKANFSVNDSIICLGQTLLLNSANSIDAHAFSQNDSNVVYLWNLDDNSILYSIDTATSYTYKKEGNFKVKLKITDAHLCQDSAEQTIYVHKPHSSFSADKTSGCLPLFVKFTNNSSSYFPIISNKWNFGNGDKSSASDTSIVYTNNGNFDVSLIVQDDKNCIDTLNKLNFIKTDGPVPNFHADKTKICVGDNVRFSFSSQSVNIISVLWNFGDGNTSTEISPVHKYTTAGSFSISLTLSGDSGCDSSKTIVNYINVQNIPIADFYADTTIANCYPLLVHFYDNSHSAYINSYTWNLGDNTISHLKNPAYAYLKPGNFNISLTVKTTNGCSNTKNANNFISVKGPYAEILAHDTICKHIATDFKLKNQKNINYLRWFFGQGATTNDTSPKYTYDIPGNYNTILLLKSDSSGICTKYIIKPISVRDINADFIIDSLSEACPPFRIKVTDTTKNTFSRLWNFDNSSYDNSPTAYHSFQSQGNKNISLFEKDSFGCLDTITKTLTVNPLPIISIIPDTFICRGKSIQLYASGANYYTWTPSSFLDNPNINNPICFADSSILYSLSATSDKGCKSTKNTKITVIQKPKFLIKDTSIIIGDTITLNNFSAEIASYSWTPSTGLTCTNCASPLAAPLESTYYSLSISDTAKCFDLSKTIFIDVMQKYSLDVPSAFSPNGDGVNDIIYVKGWGIKELLFFKIYNRYGQLVFYSNKLYDGWDGNYKNQPQPVETYRYDVAVKTFAGNILTKSGTIKLLR